MRSRSTLTVVALLLFAAPVLAHEDDPKVLSRLPAYRGPGFQSGWAAAPEASGLSIETLAPPIQFPSSGVGLLAWLPIEEFGSSHTSANDCWGYVAPSGREYAILGLSHGTAFVEVTSPSSPDVVAVLGGPISLWRDVKTYDEYAYAVSEGGQGIQVFDLTQIDSGVVGYVGAVTAGGFTTATHNVVVDEVSGRLYRAGGNTEGLRIYDLTGNPAAPTYVGSWPDRYVHDAQVVTYTSGPFANRQIAFACSGDNFGFTNTGLDVLDVTDPNNIQNLFNLQYPNAVYSHQAWLSPDRNYLYLNDELDENGFLPTTTFVIDVSNPAAPFFASSFTNGNSAIGHNLYTRGDFIYEANYRSGMRVFDASVNPLSPVEVGYFDTFPEDDAEKFNGLWSVYPYLPSGIVFGSDLEKGLFVWHAGAPELTFSVAGGLPSALDPAGASFVVSVAEETPGDLVGGTVQIHYDAGAGLVSQVLPSLGAGNHQVTLPAIPCGQDVAYYFTGQSTSGIVWQHPAGPAAAAVASVTTSVALSFPMNANDGWSVGDVSDTAFTGIWERGNPIGTSAQPENDHTPVGTDCWFTGQGPFGGSVGDNDVDGGTTTLFSPILDVTSLVDPRIQYWRWYSNVEGSSAPDDAFVVDISDDGGSSWTRVETIGPAGVVTAGGWWFHGFRVDDYVSPTSQVQVRFIADDSANGSIVEAAVDDFEVVESGCPDCNTNGLSDDLDLAGSFADFDGNGMLDVCQPLSEDVAALSLSAGGTVSLVLDAGTARAGEVYWVFGSATGTAPGTSIGTVLVPLNFDGYFKLTLFRPFAGIFTTFIGILSPSGTGTAAFSVPPGVDPGLAGITLNHAFVSSPSFGGADYASNAMPVLLLP